MNEKEINAHRLRTGKIFSNVLVMGNVAKYQDIAY